jgi:hypothetical protein
VPRARSETIEEPSADALSHSPSWIHALDVKEKGEDVRIGRREEK